jgi:cell division protein FtsA
MSRKPDANLSVSLDMGTSKTAVVVAELGDDGHVRVVGHGEAPSRGIKKGVVVNMEATTKSIEQAMKEANEMASCTVQSVFASVTGSHLKSQNSQGIVPVAKPHREVTPKDVAHVIQSASALAISADQQILHVLPQEYILDDQDGISEPVGMSGVRLEARVHMVTASKSATQNLHKCISHCGLTANRLVLQSLAAAHAVLNEDERELGVVLLDIGGGTTDIAVFQHGSLRHSAVIPLGGDHITNDIAVAMRAPFQSAEAIKVEHGCAVPELIEGEDTVQVRDVGDRPPRMVSRHMLTEVVRARVDEIFRLALRKVREGGFDHPLPAGGVVLTGGSAQLPGICLLAEEIFERPARVGLPLNVSGLEEISKSPAYATAVGLLRFGKQAGPSSPNPGSGTSFAAGWDKLKSWFQRNF